MSRSRRRVAVLLNRRAQGVTARRLAWFRDRVPAHDLFVCGDGGADESRATLTAIVDGGHDVVCTGGGDGTFMQTAAALIALAPPAMPALLPLRLGTGNAIHDVSGSARPTPRGLAHDLARAADPGSPIAPLRLLEVEGRLTQFAGVGLDADWADDYAQLIKRFVGKGPLLPLLRGVPGYALTAIARTVPRLLRRPFVQVRLIAPDGARALDGEGRAVRELPAGATLYAGPATMVSVSTVTSYSAGFRFFRNVDRIGDAFELKVGIAGPFQVLLHARRLLDGGHDPRRILDFAVPRLRVELDAAAPYHIGGDVLPAVRGFSVGTSRHTVPVLRPG